MNKKNRIISIFSLIVVFVLLSISAFIPSMNATKTLFAEEISEPLYAFVSSKEGKVVNGKINVEFGLSIDIGKDKVITSNDAEMMVSGGIEPFESAKIYFRTRNVSAISEEGDYEAIDQSFTVYGTKPYSSVEVKVNNTGLQVGGVARQFYVEIYKVELVGHKESYPLYQPYTTREISSDILSTGSEFQIGKKIYSNVDKLDLDYYSYLTSPEIVCQDVTKTTKFNDIKINLANIGNNWYNKVKYMSDRGMLKLGIRTVLAAYEAPNGVYTDNSFVGLQIFGGDSRNVGAPALQGVPEQNVYKDPSVVELSRWFAKFQSDEREDLDLSNAFSGDFDGVTVQSLFDDSVLLAHSIAKKDYGQGGIYDAETSAAWEDVFIIDDLNAAFQGSTTLSVRAWKYRSSKEKYFDGFINFVPTNYRAKAVNATLGKLYKDENGKDKIGVSLRFNEPVQFKKYNDGRVVAPYIEGYINHNAANALKFEYVAGEGTDTLFFEADVSVYKMNITRISLKTAHGFEDVYDYAPNCDGAAPAGSSQNMNVINNSIVNGWDNISTNTYVCSYDLREPEIDINENITKSVKTSHMATIRTNYISEKGSLFYAWTTDNTNVPKNLLVEPISSQGFQTVASPSNVTGIRYLYAYAVSEYGKQSEPMWIGPFNFDNEAPRLSVKCIKNTYQEKEFSIHITNNTVAGFERYAELKKNLKAVVTTDSKGKNVVKEISIPLPDNDLRNESLEVESFTLKAATLGLELGSELEFGTYYLFFTATDILENQSSSEPTAYYFDVRDIFSATLVKNDFAMDEFATGKLSIDENYYTIDLSKVAEGKVLSFNVSDLNSIGIEEFVNVNSDDALSKVSVASSGGNVNITIVEKFNPGLYRLTLKDNAVGSNKKSLPIYFYVTDGRVSANGLYQEETGGYKSLSENVVFTNKAFQIPTSVSYYYMTDSGTEVKQSYGVGNRPVIFSSWGVAHSYILYREYLDLYAVTLTQSLADSLNSETTASVHKKAEGVNQIAEAGQVWIRYKEVNWKHDSTTNDWVYYYYGEEQSPITINIDALSKELRTALYTVANMICSDCEELNLITEEYLDQNGAPTLRSEQIRLNKESSKTSISGTVFENSVEYLGDTGLNLSLDPNAPLSTNAILQTKENRYYYYKTDASEYRLLTMDNHETTLGEYFNVTGKISILELDETGVREYYIYIDKSAPELEISWTTPTGKTSKTFSKDDNGQTISGNNFSLENITDYDAMSFVAIYRYTNKGEGDFLSVYRKSDFDDGKIVRLEDGKYHVHVSDRSGNSYIFVLQVKSTPLVFSIREVDNSYIRVELNRDETEVRYQVYLNGRLFTTDYKLKQFTESGEYRFIVEDIYGNVYDEKYVFERVLPVVNWRYQLSDGSFVPYEKDSEKIKINKIDDQNYLISTSTYLRFQMLDGCAYEIISGDPSPSKNIMLGLISLNNKTPFTMKVYYESYPEVYVIYTCMVDDTLPQVNVSYEKGYYNAFELDEIKDNLQNGKFLLGENPFTPSLIGFGLDEVNSYTLFVANGQQVQSKYFKVQATDESGIKDVKIYCDDKLILTKQSNFNNIYISRRGAYKIVATDNFGNMTTFTFVNDYTERAEYFVDGGKISTDVSFADYFNDKTYTKVEYGKSQVETRILTSSQIHYLITDADGKSYYFAFVVEDGNIYTFQYVVKIVQGETDIEIENLSARSVNALSSGIVAKIDKIGVAISLSKNGDGTFLLRVHSTDDVKKTYTVETRISSIENQSEMPYYFKTTISTLPSSIEFIDESGNLIPTSQTIKVNKSFVIRDNVSQEIERIDVSFSMTGNYTTYETVYDGTYRRVVFDKEGTYHVKVINIYGNQTDYYIVISSQFVMSATIDYIDGTSIEYSTNYIKENNDFYSNKSVEFIVYAINVKVLDKDAAINVMQSEQGYTTIYINTPGSYFLNIEDEYGNSLKKNVYINADTFTIDENTLTNFNDKALRRDENYTNKNIFINKNALNESGIAFIGMVYGDKIITIYDNVSEIKTAFDESKYVGVLGDGEYKLVFRDRYGNKAETVIHYCGTPTLTILRNTLNGARAEIYSIDEALSDGVWTNNSVSFSINATKYVLKVDGKENVKTITYDAKTKNEYEVYYLDEYGFEYTFKVHLHREDVVITPAESMSVTQLSDMLITKDSVRILFTENAFCSYTLNNEPAKNYDVGDVLYKDGIYRFKVMDKAGNVSTYTVKKDSTVEYRIEGSGANEILINGGVTNSKNVKFFAENSDNAYIKKVFHNNEFIEYDDEIFTERGKWELLIADDAGNESYFRFYILYGKIDGFSYNTPYNYYITSVIWEMQDSIADATETIKDQGLRLEVTENGKYSVTMQSLVTGDVQTFTFTVDKTPPQVELVGCQQNEKTINNITIKGCLVGDTVYVYKDGVLYKTVSIDSDYMDPPTISEAGKYKIVVENEAGVQTELSFERKYVPNVAGSVLIIVLSFAAVVGLFVGLIWRNHSKTDD